MIQFEDSTEEITAGELEGFFADWGTSPSAETLLCILHGSDHVVLARDTEASRVIGLITAISDDISSAFIPHLEVLPAWRGQGIGTELMRRMLGKLEHLYAIDIMCDPDVQTFYARLGMRPYTGMIRRNYARQACD